MVPQGDLEGDRQRDLAGVVNLGGKTGIALLMGNINEAMVDTPSLETAAGMRKETRRRGGHVNN